MRMIDQMKGDGEVILNIEIVTVKAPNIAH